MADLDTFTRTLRRALAGEESPEPPAPWLGWLLVCLCRQRARQRWLSWIQRTRLRGVDADEGVVPGLPEWRYEFHGQGLCLSGPNNECVDADFHDEACATIDPYFFAGRVLRLESPPPPEARIGELFANPAGIALALKELRNAGVLVHESSDHVFQLAPPIEALHEEVAAVPFEEREVHELWRLALGDGPDAGDHFASWLEGRCRDRVVARELLPTVERALDPERTRRLLVGYLPGPIDTTTAYAAEILDRLDADPTPLRAILPRLDPARHHPFPAYAVCRFLLRRGLDRDTALTTVEAFASVPKVQGYHGNPFGDRLALLLLEHGPDRALPHVRRALRSSTPAVVQDIAATLAAIGQSWCVRELTAALREPAEKPANQRYLAAALAKTGDDLAARRAERLAPPPPVHEGPGYTIDEVVFANLNGLFGSAFDQASELAERLRALLPDDFGSDA